jgi:hypothetical protein
MDTKGKNMTTNSYAKFWIKVSIVATAIVLTAFVYSSVYAQEGYYIIPTIPGTNMPDPALSGYVRQGDTYYQTVPGTTMVDPAQSGYIVQDYGDIAPQQSFFPEFTYDE